MEITLRQDGPNNRQRWDTPGDGRWRWSGFHGDPVGATAHLTVIATASREESRTWVEQSGGHHVVNHHNLRKEVAEVAPEGVHYIFSPFSAGNVQTYADIMTVHGRASPSTSPKDSTSSPSNSRARPGTGT